MIYSFDDYRKALLSRIQALKELRPDFTLTQIAEKAGMQPSYLTNVLKGRAEFNTDQIYRVAELLDLSADKIDFLILLLEYSRTSLPSRRSLLKNRIAEIRAKQLRADSVLDSKKMQISDLEQAQYYLDPFVEIIHMYLNLNSVEFDVPSISRRFGLSQKQTAKILDLLERLQLLVRQGKKWKVLGVTKHLTADSPFSRAHLVSHRQLAIDRIWRVGTETCYSFSGTFSCSEEAREKIKAEFLSFLKKFEKLVTESSSDELYQINFDLFPW